MGYPRYVSDLTFVAQIRRQRAFSEKTFGPGDRRAGVLDHMRKEIAEVEEIDDPTETLGEWVDLILLALDGAWRCGATPEEIESAIVAKQAMNEARQWPDWRAIEPGKAIEHVRAETKS